MCSKILLSALIIISFSAPVMAQEGPCGKDIELHCKGISTGRLDVIRCLNENATKVSPECKAHAENVRDELQTMQEACARDVNKFCAEQKDKRQARLKCLRKNRQNLSFTCRNQMKKLKNMKAPKAARASKASNASNASLAAKTDQSGQAVSDAESNDAPLVAPAGDASSVAPAVDAPTEIPSEASDQNAE